MNFVYFTHSLVSCWNHGNAHFLRGVLRELVRRGHRVTAWEPAESWSRRNLMADHGALPVLRFMRAFPDLPVHLYGRSFDLDRMLDGADVVIVHEWNDPGLVAAIGRKRAQGGRFTLLFHDTHHRAVSAPEEMQAFDLSGYDGVLAFGEAVAHIYRSWGWGRRAFVWHEAADMSVFRPAAAWGSRRGLVWVGNWGDGERSSELSEFLIEPARTLHVPLDIYGVRYPESVRRMLAAAGVHFHGWLPNIDVPNAFSRASVTVHVPRRYYANMLPGIPTIRVFEALACGIPLLCAPWDDCEGLFRPGKDYLVCRNGEEMRARLRDVTSDPGLREALASSGRETIIKHHTCSHRAEQLLAVTAGLCFPTAKGAA